MSDLAELIGRNCIVSLKTVDGEEYKQRDDAGEYWHIKFELMGDTPVFLVTNWARLGPCCCECGVTKAKVIMAEYVIALELRAQGDADVVDLGGLRA